MTVTDIHTHAIIPDALRAMAAAHPDFGPEVFEEGGQTFLQYPGGRARLGPLHPGIFDPEARLAEMDSLGIARHVVAIAPPNSFYHIPAEPGIDFARAQNDALMAWSDAHPERLHVFGTLPLQDVDASLAEFARILEHPRVRGIQIGTNVAGVDLDDERFEPLWEASEAADSPIWVHGDQRQLAGADRLNNYYLQNFIGQPLESTIAMGKLIFSGVLERHPDLRFGWCHGGGFLPYQIGRWDHGWACRPEAVQVIDQHPPSSYFSKMFFDTLTHDPMSLRFLVERVGADHVVLGSDYPFDMASADPVGAARDAISDQETLDAVFENNADRFLRPIA